MTLSTLRLWVRIRLGWIACHTICRTWGGSFNLFCESSQREPFEVIKSPRLSFKIEFSILFFMVTEMNFGIFQFFMITQTHCVNDFFQTSANIQWWIYLNEIYLKNFILNKKFYLKNFYWIYLLTSRSKYIKFHSKWTVIFCYLYMNANLLKSFNLWCIIISV